MNGSLTPLPSHKLASSTNAITIPGASAPPGSPSRTRSASTPPPSTPEILRNGVALKNSANLQSIQENGHSDEAPPSYDSLNGASKEDSNRIRSHSLSTTSLATQSPREAPKESSRNPTTPSPRNSPKDPRRPTDPPRNPPPKEASRNPPAESPRNSPNQSRRNLSAEPPRIPPIYVDPPRTPLPEPPRIPSMDPPRIPPLDASRIPPVDPPVNYPIESPRYVSYEVRNSTKESPRNPPADHRDPPRTPVEPPRKSSSETLRHPADPPRKSSTESLRHPPAESPRKSSTDSFRNPAPEPPRNLPAESPRKSSTDSFRNPVPDPPRNSHTESPRNLPLEPSRNFHAEPSREPSEFPLPSPRQRQRRNSIGDEYGEREEIEESPRAKDYLSENETSCSSREPHRRTVRHMLSRMNSMPRREILKMTKDLVAPASPQQTASKPPKVLKRNPSFWEMESKKGKNQMTLRRYTDVGIVTVTLNVSGTIFATSTNTLLREQDTLFATILEREETSIRAGKQIFLDRNPKYFGPILDYMRTGTFDRDAHIKYAKSIMVEAEFFKVKGLIKLLHEVPELSRTQVIQIINASEKPKLRGLWLPTVNLAGLDLTKANLDFSQLGRCNFRNVLLGGASICNASMVDINLRNAVLNHATIANTDFNRANISNSTLRFVKCSRCDFTDADLSFCAFEGSDFHGCDFSGANLTGADFTSADLTNSVFRNAVFSEETVFGNTITKNVDYEGSNIDVTKKKGGVFAMLGKKKKG